jgi:hypothetical protein
MTWQYAWQGLDSATRMFISLSATGLAVSDFTSYNQQLFFW